MKNNVFFLCWTGACFTAVAGILLWLLGSCASMAPVNSSFESAKTLSRGQVEVLANYSSYSLSMVDEAGDHLEQVNYNYGLRLGYGLSNRVDLKLRYERLTPVLAEDREVVNGAHYFALTPRYSIIRNRLSGAVDMGLYTYTLLEDASTESEFHLSPRLAFSYPSGKNFDLTLGSKLDIFIPSGAIYLGFTLGCGISNDLDVWALRPELGYITNPGTNWFSFGAGFVMKFGKKKDATAPVVAE